MKNLFPTTLTFPRNFTRAVLLLALIALPAQALTDAEATAGRGLVKRYADAIIGVELVVTIKGLAGAQTIAPRELKREVNGTVISATGLTVISLTEIDPRGAMGGQTNLRLDEPEFKEVKLRTADGAEVAAQIVLKDADQDLAFVAPLPDAAGGRTFVFVKLEDPAEPGILNSLFFVSRASKQQQRAQIVVPASVIGVIEKPRRLIMASNYVLGCPAFDVQGKLLGIALRNLSGGQQAGVAIVPGADIAEIAKQAAAIKPEALSTSVPDPK